MNTYQQAVLKARKKFLRLNKSQEKELLNLYTELAKQLEIDISKWKWRIPIFVDGTRHFL